MDKDAEANGGETELKPPSSPAYDHCLDNLILEDPGKQPLFEEYVEMSKSSFSKLTPLHDVLQRLMTACTPISPSHCQNNTYNK